MCHVVHLSNRNFDNVPTTLSTTFKKCSMKNPFFGWEILHMGHLAYLIHIFYIESINTFQHSQIKKVNLIEYSFCDYTSVCVICSGAKRWAFVDNYTSRKYRETIYKTVILTALLLFNTSLGTNTKIPNFEHLEH